ncbi:MAG: hypothetical protein O7I93_02760 [Gemmatimonadetes bacterium]|nr:hypothetical protein [Gemmatimonadota bacterium]
MNRHARACALALGAVLILMGVAPAEGQQVNENNLWYGNGPGMEVVFRTGQNLAFTEEDPEVDPRMTKHARGMDQALIKIGERTYLAYGWAMTSPMMVVGDDGLIVIDPPESLEAGS